MAEPHHERGRIEIPEEQASWQTQPGVTHKAEGISRPTGQVIRS